MNTKQAGLLKRYSIQLKFILKEITRIENDLTIPISDKFTKIKIIREEITKVTSEIDKIKKEINLQDTLQIN